MLCGGPLEPECTRYLKHTRLGKTEDVASHYIICLCTHNIVIFGSPLSGVALWRWRCVCCLRVITRTLTDILCYKWYCWVGLSMPHVVALFCNYPSVRVTNNNFLSKVINPSLFSGICHCMQLLAITMASLQISQHLWERLHNSLHLHWVCWLLLRLLHLFLFCWSICVHTYCVGNNHLPYILMQLSFGWLYS